MLGQRAIQERPITLLHSAQAPADIIHNVSLALGGQCHTEVVPDEVLASSIDAAYSLIDPQHDAADSVDASEYSSPNTEALIARAERDLLSTDGKADLTKLVDGLLFDAIRAGASDLHVQPQDEHVLVRMRVDGVLRDVRSLASGLAGPVISRIKVMGGMDIAERRVPQDGRASVTLGAGRTVDLRISTLPTSRGERAVVRLLDNQGKARASSLEELGMPANTRDRFLDSVMRSFGIVLVTGPTGSGKTTTLYSTLRTLAVERRGEQNIMTIEDPIEFDLSGDDMVLSQSQVNSRKGVSFASGLRHILRQDPDVVMVGEIRDAETAGIAVQASLTGHVVLSTLHTNDAASAVTRLIDLGVEPYLVTASLNAVLAQRLVRTSHAACQGTGCDDCFGTGYRGRTGVFELLTMTDDIRSAITRGCPLAEIRALATERGMRTLQQEGRRLVEEEITSETELARAVQEAL